MNNRTQASSFDNETFSEVMEVLNDMAGKTRDAGIPEDFDDELLGQNAKDEAERNYQRGQEIATLIAMTGWTYIKESLEKMIVVAEVEFKKAETDEEILRLRRDWKATEKAVHQIIANVESAAMVPHPDELPI